MHKNVIIMLFLYSSILYTMYNAHFKYIYSKEGKNICFLKRGEGEGDICFDVKYRPLLFCVFNKEKWLGKCRAKQAGQSSTSCPVFSSPY